MSREDDSPATAHSDRGAEMAALGAVLMSPQPADTAADVFGVAPAEEFWGERALAEVLEGMWRAKRPIDPQLVLERLTATGIASKVGGAPHLHDLIERAWNVANAKFYAEIVHEAWRRRTIATEALRVYQRAGNPESDLTELAIGMMDAGEKVIDEGRRAREVSPPADVLDFVHGPHEYDWLIPGLVERLDRIMLTAPEGTAKSVILAQIALAAAVGLDPFSHRPIPPMRALVIDCEVSPRQQRRRWNWLLDTAKALGKMPEPGMLRIEPRPDGLDLTGSDLGWAKGKVRASGADLVVIGPLYRLHRGNINDEEAARELVGALDEIRVGSNVALLVEAHAGHGTIGRSAERDLRPRGSSLFMGWTEFGCGLRPVKGDRRVVDVTRWRGDRDARTWPSRLRWGTGLTWPWVECRDDAEPTDAAKASLWDTE